MVGSATEQRQGDVPAHEQVGDEVEFEVAVGTGIGPGGHDLGADKGANGKGRSGAGSGRMIVVATCDDNSGRVVEESHADEGMVSALDEHGLIDESTDPGENEGEKAAEDSLDEWREVRKLGERVRGWEW